MEKDQINQSPRSDEDMQDDSLLKSLKNFGFVFSDSDDEVEDFYRSFLSMESSLPTDLMDSSCIFNSGPIGEAKVLPIPVDPSVVANLAQAAREGSSISEEMLEKMKRDRMNAEKLKKQ